MQYVYNESFRSCLYWYINVRLACRERHREREVHYLTTLSIAKLIGAQCHCFVNEVRVWSNDRMTVTGESGVHNDSDRGEWST